MVYVCIVKPDIQTIHRCSHTSIHAYIHTNVDTHKKEEAADINIITKLCLFLISWLRPCYIHTYIHTYTHTHTQTLIHIKKKKKQISILLQSCAYFSLAGCDHVTYIHTYIHTHTHTHTNVDTHKKEDEADINIITKLCLFLISWL